MYRDIATTLYKREDLMKGYLELPPWVWALFIVNVLVFLPIYLIISYTLQFVYPTLAIVEDPSPPAYDPVSLNDDGASIAEDRLRTTDTAAISEAPIITASLRSTHRAVYAIAGWQSLFRGYAAYIFLGLASTAISVVLHTLYVPALLATAIAPLALVQPYAAWTHIIISTPSPKSFWQRLPPFKRAFKATALPLVLHTFAVRITAVVPYILAKFLRMNIWDPTEYKTDPFMFKNSDIWKGILVLLATLTLQIVLVIPTQVALTRVQASFLPEEYDTIVPFDRTFGGKVEPVVVSGQGYVNVLDAMRRVSRKTYARLVRLYCKIFAIGIVLSVLAVSVLIPEYLVLAVTVGRWRF